MPSSGTPESVCSSGPQHGSAPSTARTVRTSAGPAQPSTRPGPVRSSANGSGHVAAAPGRVDERQPRRDARRVDPRWGAGRLDGRDGEQPAVGGPRGGTGEHAVDLEAAPAAVLHVHDRDPAGLLDGKLRAVGREGGCRGRAVEIDDLGGVVSEVEQGDLAGDPPAGVGVRRLVGHQARERLAVARPCHRHDAASRGERVRRGLAGGQVDDDDVRSLDVVVADHHPGAVGRQQHRCRVALGLGAGPLLGDVDAAVGVASGAEHDRLREVEELDAVAVLPQRDDGSRR